MIFVLKCAIRTVLGGKLFLFNIFGVLLKLGVCNV